jgi:uncharacterized coiled-coil DUF342 family protein
MRSAEEIKDKIHELHSQIMKMESRVKNKKRFGSVGITTTEMEIHALNQDICLLRWVLEPLGHQHSAGS